MPSQAEPAPVEFFPDSQTLTPNMKQDAIAQIISANPALAMLAQLDRGRIVADLAEAYPALVEAVHRTRKPGELQIKIKIKPVKGEPGGLNVAADVLPKVPKNERRETFFFVTEDNLLSREDPQQPDLPFAQAEASAAAR